MGSSASDAFHELDPASSGGSGRKLHADAGRFATRLKIWLSSRCCSVISCACARARASAPSGRVARGGAYYLGVEFYEARLAVVVEDEDGVDHGGCVVETDLTKIVASVRESDKVMKKGHGKGGSTGSATRGFLGEGVWSGR